ncbi:bestrophin family protein [Tabrizicola sp.]|uniref:bestrophin family protein n=1 Tax=Tabrizicola sp. TaxID=2005166 RepID=UPI0027367F9E|nr:bestrophin family ion channel [Tabrizicola sp.]MDP3197055.1 bestrophin family ion channel [Tabrizicola sp.]
MIIRDKPGILALLFAVRGSVLPHIAPQLLFFGLFAAAIVTIDRYVLTLPHVQAAPLAVFGVALSLFLGFRNNAAYDRWWEARRLWGGLLADARSMAREAELFLSDPADRRRLLTAMRAFLHQHRCALRGLPNDEPALRDTPAAPTPDATLDAMGSFLADALHSGRMDGFGARTLSTRLSSIALAQAGCERIKLTPLPYVYSLLIFRTSWLYCLLLPFALLEPTGWLTPLFVVIVAYTFFGLAEVTEELAHPFGLTANALPLDAICRTAEISLAPHLGEPAPPPLLPVDYRLD